jgi:hypothetical protein
MPEKCKADRLKETLRLLAELKRVGISETVSGYSEIKRIMTQWVNDGKKTSAVVELPRHGRQADLSLPDMDNKAASINLRVVVKPEELERED